MHYEDTHLTRTPRRPSATSIVVTLKRGTRLMGTRDNRVIITLTEDTTATSTLSARHGYAETFRIRSGPHRGTWMQF